MYIHVGYGKNKKIHVTDVKTGKSETYMLLTIEEMLMSF